MLDPPPYDSLLSEPQQGRKNDKHRGWKRGILVCAYSIFAIFLINLVLLIVAVAKQGIGVNGQAGC
jgi:hypothetical protein